MCRLAVATRSSTSPTQRRFRSGGSALAQVSATRRARIYLWAASSREADHLTGLVESKGDDLADFLRSGREIVAREEGTA
jgi:hypothetical protein